MHTRTIVLLFNARVFERAGKEPSSLLGNVRRALPMGTKLTIGEPVTMVYDHQNQVAVEILDGDEEGSFFILKELGLSELMN